MSSVAAQIQISLNDILIATDFSPASHAALQFALPLAQRSRSTVHLVHVLHAPELAIVPPDSEQIQRIRQDAQQQLHKLEVLIGSAPHRTWLPEGEVSEEIEKLVRSKHIDLIVVGSCGKSKYKKFLLGSVAEEILRAATCPVLAVGPRLASALPAGFLTQLLYVTNFREESHDGLRHALSLAIRDKAELVILHVVEQAEPMEKDQRALERYRRMLRTVLPASVPEDPIEPVLRIESAMHPTARILQVADEINAGLIVMDVQPEEPWATHLRDNVYETISCAKCPVLSVRTRRKPAYDEGPNGE